MAVNDFLHSLSQDTDYLISTREFAFAILTFVSVIKNN